MDREAWRAAVHGVTKSQTRLSDRTKLNLTKQKQTHRLRERTYGCGEEGEGGGEDGGRDSEGVCTHCYILNG